MAHANAQFVRAKRLEPLSHYLPPPDRDAGGSLFDRLKEIAARTGGGLRRSAQGSENSHGDDEQRQAET